MRGDRMTEPRMQTGYVFFGITFFGLLWLGAVWLIFVCEERQRRRTLLEAIGASDGMWTAVQLFADLEVLGQHPIVGVIRASLQRLEDLGLITSKVVEDPSNRTQTRFTLTDAGRKVIGE